MINYYLITKPGIILGNLMTVAAGFLLASKGQFDATLFLAAFLGLALIIASACVFNNYIDRNLDKKMERTKNRPLATGLIPGLEAILFAMILATLGIIILLLFTNYLTAAAASFGFLVYVLLYSFIKCKTIYATAIGSIAGAIPPLVGYFAAGNRLDLGAVIFFALMVFWQMPHFFAIATYRLVDYSNAGIPVLPTKKGMLRTKIHMVLYILGFIFTTAQLTYFGYTSHAFLYSSVFLGLMWLALCCKGFRTQDNIVWGKQMFRFSLITISAICFMIIFVH